MIKLTKRQHEILALIQSHMTATGSPPTRAEIAKTMGFRSPNAAEDHLRALARKGVIELVPGTSRGIRLTKSSGIPIVTRAYPKQPLLAEEHFEATCRLDKNFFTPAIDFLYKLPNSSDLSQFGLLPGDFVAVYQTDKVQNGQLVLVRQNNDLHIQRHGSEKSMEQPQTIEGLLVGVIRNLTSSPLP